MRRIGKFSIDNSVIRMYLDGAVIGLDKNVFSNFVIVRAEYRFESERVEYIAYSNLFEEVHECCQAPRYHLKLKLDEDNTVTISSVEILK